MNKELPNFITSFCKKNGYYTASKLGEWNNYIVFIPQCHDDEFMGLPKMILKKDSSFRLATMEELFQILEAFPED